MIVPPLSPVLSHWCRSQTRSSGASMKAATVTAPISEDDGIKLAGLRTLWPRWTFWKGEHTGSWWAMPPPGVRTLINADDLDRLAAMVADVESWGARS